MAISEEILQKIKPYVLGWIRDVQASALGAHDLGGSLHTGTLLDSQGPQFLKTDGGRQLTGNLAVADLVTIDGVDISALNSAYTTHVGLSATAAHGSVGAHNHQTTGAGGLLDHGLALSGLGDDDHTQYLNLARHDVTARHTLGTVVPHDVHSALSGLSSDDHIQYLLADGSRAVTGSLLPAITDAYDLGSSTKLWRKGWLSELDAVLFAQNTITLLGGWLLVTKSSGTMPADVSAGATQIDFGQAMTVSDFVLLRAAGKVEYIQVGTLVSGTTYNVTRNVDGSGANDWPAGAPYAVLGQSGDGRIELSAAAAPRISILEQGETYNATTDLVRIGDLNGSYGVTSDINGFGVGDYAGGNYLKYDGTNGFVLKAGSGAVSLGPSGLIFTMNDVDGISDAAVQFVNADSTATGVLYSSINDVGYLYLSSGLVFEVQGSGNAADLKIRAGAQNTAAIGLKAYDPSDALKYSEITLQTYPTGTSGGEILLQSKNILLTGNSVLTGQITMTNWDGWLKETFSITYLSSTQFRVNGGALGDLTSRYAPGTKLKVVNNGSTKYFYVISSSYSGGNTDVTVFAGTAYSLASGTISEVWYSYAARPQGHPIWFNYTATLSGSSGSAGTYAEDGAVATFMMTGKSVTIHLTKRITNKGSWSGDVILTRPFNMPTSWYWSTAGAVLAQSQVAPKAWLGTSYSVSHFGFLAQMGTGWLQWANVQQYDFVMINGTFFI